MNAERLLQLYDRVSDAPDSVPRLRRFILDLAMRGKLVKQDPDDEPVSDMLKRIEIDRQHRGKARKVRKSSGDGNLGHVPHPIPPNWRWLPLGDLGYTQTGATPPKSHPEHYGDYIPFLRPGNLFESYVDYSGGGLSAVGIKASGRLAQPGSVLMVCIGTIGKCQILDRPASFNQQINSISPYADTNPHFLLRVLQAPYFQDAAWNASARTTIAILNKSNWEKIPIPLAPLAEQHRIVAKVDELMALCDSLEGERDKREATRDRLTTASLSRLTAPDVDEEQFRAQADFAINVLPELTTRPDQIKMLRQAILDLAVQGKLVEQDPNDEPVRKNLRRIGEEKENAALVVTKQSASSSSIDGDGHRHVIPPSWSWAEIGCVVGVMKNGLNIKQNKTPSKYRVTRIETISHEKIDISRVGFVNDLTQAQLQKHAIEVGDILFSHINSEAHLGKTAICTLECECLIHGVNLLLLRPTRDIDPHFLNLTIRHLRSSGHFISIAQRAVNQSSINQKRLAGTIIPVAPLAEQHRIVAKAYELMTLCNQLEAGLNLECGSRSRLLEVLLKKAPGRFLAEIA